MSDLWTGHRKEVGRRSESYMYMYVLCITKALYLPI